MIDNQQSIRSLESDLRTFRSENDELKLLSQTLRTQNSQLMAQVSQLAPHLASKISSSNPPSTSNISTNGGGASHGHGTHLPAPGGTGESLSTDRARELEQMLGDLQRDNQALEKEIRTLEKAAKAELEVSQSVLSSVKSQLTRDEQVVQLENTSFFLRRVSSVGLQI